MNESDGHQANNDDPNLRAHLQTYTTQQTYTVSGADSQALGDSSNMANSYMQNSQKVQ